MTYFPFNDMSRLHLHLKFLLIFFNVTVMVIPAIISGLRMLAGKKLWKDASATLAQLFWNSSQPPPLNFSQIDEDPVNSAWGKYISKWKTKSCKWMESLKNLGNQIFKSATQLCPVSIKSKVCNKKWGKEWEVRWQRERRISNPSMAEPREMSVKFTQLDIYIKANEIWIIAWV